jgi:pyrroline-5-carboxylate reductase
LADKDNISVSDVAAERRDQLKKMYGVRVTDDNVSALAGAEVVIFAIKPQEMGYVLGQLSGKLKTQLIISIAAGVTLESICSKLNYRQVVRAMPNTPAQVGQGMTVWIAAKETTAGNVEVARSILKSMGEEQNFTEEKYIDMATAVSGSGPAYVFLFIEAMIDAGVHIGLQRNIAQKLVIETVAGSAEVMKKMTKHPAELKNMVTSPGGTTSEALLQFEKGGIRSIMIDAVTAAYNKAKSLGEK